MNLFGKCRTLLIVAILLLSVSAYANDAKEARKDEYKAYEGTIPLPRLMAYSGKGMNIGLGLGAIRPLGNDEKVLPAWRIVGDYYYWSFLSAGLEVLVYGGNVSNDVMILYSRYRLHSRFHFQPSKRIDLFFAPLLWFETTDIDDTQMKIDSKGDSVEVSHSSIYDEAPEQNGFAVGAEAGLGIRLPANFGLFAESVYEQLFSGGGVYASTAGFGYDIRAVSAFFRRNTYALWVSWEATSRRYVGKNWDKTGHFYFVGLHLSM